jgi:hypothetical protein
MEIPEVFESRHRFFLHLDVTRVLGVIERIEPVVELRTEFLYEMLSVSSEVPRFLGTVLDVV